jgi:uncharacterized membrane protein
MNLSIIASVIVVFLLVLFVFKTIKKLLWIIIISFTIAALFLYVPDTDFFKEKILPAFSKL